MSKELEFPHSETAERAVLACLLQHDRAMDEVSPLLVPDDFYVGHKQHPEIYQAMQSLYQQGEMITAAAVERLVGHSEDLFSYLMYLIEDGMRYEDGLYHARIVKAEALRRKLMRHGGETMADAANDPDAKAVLERAEARLFALSQAHGTSDPVPVADLAVDYQERYSVLELHKGGLSGLSTGFDALNFETGGFQEADLLILAGRPSTGKSSLALSIASNVVYGTRDGRVAFFTLETSKREVFARLVSMHAHVDGKRLRTPWVLHEHEKARVRQAICYLKEQGRDRLLVDDTPAISTIELRSKARRLQAKYGLALIVVDYLQMMHGLNDEGKEIKERYLEIGRISQSLKGLAKELNVPILALAQLSRTVESRADKIPQLADLRECVVGSTRLIDAKTGKWKPILEIQAGDEILGLGDHQKIGRFTVQDMWTTGSKPVFCLTTRTGRQIVATANHPLMATTGWKALSELHPGDYIATAMRLPEHGQELSERADSCRLLGYMVGDGTYQNHRGIGFISSDPETFQDVVQIATTQFPGLVPHYKTPKGHVQEVDFTYLYENGYGKPHGNPFREWMRSLGIFGQKDNCKRVPEWVFEAGMVGAREFLAGYLASDGCVKYTIDGKHIIWGIQFDTVSRWLANDIQALLLRIGVIASIDGGNMSKVATQPIYRIRVAASADNLRRFVEQVPARGKKGRLLQQLLAELPLTQTGPGLFGLPREISAYLAERTDKWRDQGKRMRRDVCMTWAECLSDTWLREWALSDLLWEEIRSIEPCGEQMVFDVSVPGCFNFIADGIITHNSGNLEQDADIVFFTYAQAESTLSKVTVIIAKHRNGPIGEVSLGFCKSETRFYNCDEAGLEVIKRPYADD